MINKETISVLKRDVASATNENPLVRAVGIYESLHDIAKIATEHLTVSITISSPESFTNRRNIYSFLEWVAKQDLRGINKTLMLNEDWADTGWKNIISPSDKRRFFYYKKRLCWYTFARETVRSSNLAIGSDMSITIRTFGFDTVILKQMAEEFMFKRKDGEINNHVWGGGKWEERGKVIPRSFRTVALNKTIKEQLINAIVNFKAHRDWYLANGIPHKFSILLEGPSGSGKTSIGRALATYFNYHLYLVNIEQMSDSTFSTALTSVHKGTSIIFIEDFEKSPAVWRTDGKKEVVTDDVASTPPVKKTTTIKTRKVEEQTGDDVPKATDLLLSSGLTRTGYLNAIDGAIPLDDVILIFSSNDITNVDGAVLRDGRMDLKIRIAELTDEDIKDFVNDMTNLSHLCDEVEFKPIMGNHLSKLFRENANFPIEFVNSIPKENSHE